jgi:hypothetical protein
MGHCGRQYSQFASACWAGSRVSSYPNGHKETPSVHLRQATRDALTQPILVIDFVGIKEDNPQR